ncbi:flagellar filament capping protein FliD [Curvibacter sp. APW13]|uniref:flagellar filament capping protein FliD n=1 Tax=Curvibacter sp. APW13 TaxID=3077236 RepID=UPI0028DFD2A8|nr:flagellar filament capping protein FliD [Curvibacter sp. APW13]MDT8992891.1 flagellar filament capping protein FliD [Curvibacter sp. APW13]
MAITSTGIGSGLDVNSIVSQLTAIEKQPLTSLKVKAAKLQVQLTTVGQIQSQVSALASAATSLGSVLGWKGVTASSANPSAIGVSATSVAVPANFNVEVTALAKAQSVALPTTVGSPALPTATEQLGYGTLSIQVGSKAAVNVTIADGKGTLSDIAAKINATTGVGVTATVVNDPSGKQNLLIRSNSTGSDGAFTITATEGTGGTISVPSNLSRLSYVSGNYAMASTQAAQNAAITLNGVAATSSTNTFANVVPGVTLTALQTTTQPAEVKIERDTASITKALQGFVSAYNALNATLSEATKYDAATNVAGPMQGDSVVTGLSNAMRRLMGSVLDTGSSYKRVADVGLTAGLGGDLALDTSKFSAAMAADLSNVQTLFTAYNGTDAKNGFGVRVKDFANGLLASSGTVTGKSSAIQKAIATNTAEQTRINDKASLFEARLKKQYSGLDSKMAQLNALNSYVAQQVTTWNKSNN